MTVRNPVVKSGESTVLDWSSTGAISCAASGGWSGSKALQGSATVGPNSQQTTYTLTCKNSSYSTVAMAGVSVYDSVTLNWKPPTTRTDGTLLTNSAGYRIHIGTDSRDYTTRIRVSDPTVTERSILLAPGSYFIAMTTLDQDGVESQYSNEVIRNVN